MEEDKKISEISWVEKILALKKRRGRGRPRKKSNPDTLANENSSTT